MAQATPFDAILAQSRDLFRDRLCEAVSGMLEHAGPSLDTLAEKAAEEELQKRYSDARTLVTARRDEIEGQFRARLLAEFQKRTNTAKKIGQTFSDFSLDQLELVGEDDLNETLKFNDMATKLRRFCDEELSALDQRVGVLLGDASLEAEDNPFGPNVICDAYKHACRQLECPVEMRMVLLKLFDDHVLDTIRASYKDVNGMLVENSILPKIRYGITKHEDRAQGPGLAHPPAADGATRAPASGEDMFAMLSKMLAPGGAGGGGAGLGVGGAPQVQGAELLGSLTRLQVGDLSALGEAAAELGPILAEVGNLKNVLHRIKTTTVGASMGQVDAMTLDIVARLFDELFEDPKVPIALKGLIGRLQLPFLKVAIADKDLFTSKSHPARLLLDVLGQIGLRLPPDFDEASPVFARLEAAIEEIVEGYEDGLEIFGAVRAKLEAILAEDDQRIEAGMQAAESQLRNAEKLALAKSVAEGEIRARVEGAAGLPRPVVEFVAQEWIKHLVIVHARDGDGSPAWKSALETTDQLLWSVTPKTTPEERRRLPGAIPVLLKGIRSGIANGGIAEAASSGFLSALMKCHTDVMRPPPAPAPVKKRAKAPAEAAASAAPLEARHAPSARVSAPAAASHPAPPAAPNDDLLDFTAPVTVNNPFGEGTVEVSADDLDFTPAAADERPAIEPHRPAVAAEPAEGRKHPPPPRTVRLPSAMVVGAWVEIAGDAGGERSRAAKLYYVSPMKSHFLFVDRKGDKVYECSRSMLARRIKLGEIGLLEGEPDASLFDRILDGLFGKLKSTAPAT